MDTQLLLCRLRTLLDHARPEPPPLESVARTHFSLSERTMQRKLTELGTSYQNEVILARLRHAQTLLFTTRNAVGKIAFDVGCASPQHLSTMFRRRTGERPSDWRARRTGTLEA